VAISKVQSPAGTYTNGGSSVSLAFGSNVTSGNLVVACVSSIYAGSPSMTAADMSKSGTATLGTWVLDKTNNVLATYYWGGAILSVPVTGTGSLTVIFTPASGFSYESIAIAEYSGTDVSGSRVDTTATGTGTSTSNVKTAQFTTSGATLIIGGLANDPNVSSDTITKGANYTLVTSVPNSGGIEVGMEQWITAGTQTNTVADWTLTQSIGWVVNAVSYKAASGGADWRKAGYWWDNPYAGRNQYWRPRGSSIFRPNRAASPDLWRKAA
jgi:hypothetical protein